jgi:diguanylate cyclase (GGDEF)-like protein/PAS domain S-box-containing protein
MPAIENKSERLHQLKQRALVLLQQQEQSNNSDKLLSLENGQLLEDLRIYQVELELQNDELRAAQQDANLARQRYQALFEQMPLPALVLDAQGLIQDLNQRAAALFGPDKRFGLADSRLAQKLGTEQRTRLHVALRDVRHGEPVLLEKLAFMSGVASGTTADGLASALLFDAHLMALSQTYHLDHRVLLLLVDCSAQAVREKEQRFFLSLLDSSDNFIYAADSHGQMLLANQAMLSFLGRSREQVVGQQRANFLPLREALVQNEADQKVLLGATALTFEEQHRVGGAMGSADFLTRKFPLHHPNGQIYGVGSISTDITEMKTRERQSLLSESVFMTAAEAIIVTDVDTRIVRVNPAFTKQSGFSAASVLGHRTNILKSGRQNQAVYQAMWQALNERGQWSGEICNRTSEGRFYTIWSNINAVRDEQGQVIHYIAIQTDITPLREAQLKVQHLASYDSLTGLPNRTLFNDRISQLIAFTRRRKNTFGLLFIDIDHFKEVNDSLGHQVGDELLKVIARRLQDAVRTEDTVARMGGDEFVVLLPGADHQQTELVANNLLAQLRAPLLLGQSVQYQPMASVGLSVFPQDGETADLLIGNADMAMYEAKLSGRNRSTSYTQQMSADNATNFAMQIELAGAAERGELRVYFQPKYRLDSGALIGAEALVRWQRPGHGLVPPMDFIPVAEKSGLLVGIDEWVLNESLRQVGQWQKTGLWTPAMRLAVNQNAADLRRPNMIDIVQGMLKTHHVAASSLELEITEDVLLEHTQELIQRLTELRQLGIVLALDDFGTGFSSLSYLRKLPIAVIKIDQSFVRGMLINEGDRVLVETIVAMAHKLGHQLVAEGIEETTQHARLIEIGCEVGQGYLFGRPTPADIFFDTALKRPPQ